MGRCGSLDSNRMRHENASSVMGTQVMERPVARDSVAANDAS